jgi:hypothetical protein
MASRFLCKGRELGSIPGDPSSICTEFVAMVKVVYDAKTLGLYPRESGANRTFTPPSYKINL